jgi:hypothetical protein
MQIEGTQGSDLLFNLFVSKGVILTHIELVPRYHKYVVKHAIFVSIHEIVAIH